MGAFTEFLALLWSIASWILERTVDLICLVLLVVACLIPWRLYFIFADSEAEQKYRHFCLQHFCMGLLEVVCLCMGLVGALVPTRTYAFAAGSVRLWVCRDRGHTKRQKIMLDFCWLWSLVLLNAIADIPCVLPGLLGLLIPTRLVATVYSTWEKRDQFALVNEYGSVECWGCNVEGRGRQAETSLRMIWFSSPFKGIIEVVGFVMGFVAMVTLIRSCQTVKEARAAAQKKSNWDGNFYNLELLQALIRNGATVLIDIAFVPLLLVLAVTGWRFSPALAAVRKRVDWEARATILRQFFLLLADLVLLLPAALVLLTWYRSRPLRQVLCPSRFEGAAPDLAEPLLPETAGAPAAPPQEVAARSAWEPLTDYHGAVLTAVKLLVLDILCLPLAILAALLACYRLPLLRAGVGAGTRFHATVWEQLGAAIVDLPFLLAGLLLLCSLYRADIAVGICRAQGRDAAWRRREVAVQLLRVIGDLLVLCLAVPIAVTLYRLPALVLGLKVKLSRPLTEEPEMEPLAMQVITPRPSGRVGFRVRASKSPNLSGVKSMQLTIMGDEFWGAVAQAPNLGPFIAQLGRALLPLGLRDGREVSYAAVAHGQAEVEVAVELEQKAKHATATKFLRNLPPATRLVLQVEGTLGDGRRAVLLAATCTAGECLLAVESEDGALPAEALLGEEVRREIAGALDQGRLRDSWWPAVLMELLRVAEDLLHLLLAALLLALPWRFASAAMQVLEPEARRPARHLHRLEPALVVWERTCGRVAALLEQRLSQHAKEAVAATASPFPSTGWRRRSGHHRGDNGMQEGVEGCIAFCCCIFCPCCPNYARLEDAGELAEDRHRAYNPNSLKKHLMNWSASLRGPMRCLDAARSSCPEGPEWASLAAAVDSWLQAQSECFYWQLLLAEWHELAMSMSGDPEPAASAPPAPISEEQHARLTEKLRARAALAAAGRRAEGERLRSRCQAQRVAAQAVRGCGLQTRQASYKILRSSFVSAVGDLLAVPMLVLLIVTFYRLPGLFSALHGVPWDVQQLKQEIRRQALGLAMDVFVTLQLLLLSALLLVTVVKFPDFIAGLQLARGVRPNRDWAVVKLSELFVGIGELLLLLTYWKTYRLAVSAAVLAVLCPAAFLAAALELPCGKVFRFSVACAVWLGLLALNLTPGLHSQLISAGVLALALAASCIGNGNKGWLKPRGGMDWWSPVVRLTLPNLLALLAIVADGGILAFVGEFAASGGVGYSFGACRDSVVTAALTVVGISIFVTALPVVADEDDQRSMVQHEAWRGASSLVHEVLFLPVVVALAPSATSSWRHGLALLYFLTISLLSSQAWDCPVPYSALLDIRSVGLCASGGRLLMTAAVALVGSGRGGAFPALAAASAAWSALWIPAGGASVPWAQLLQIGASVGGCAAALGGLRAALCVWLAFAAAALLLGLSAAAARQRELLATEVPAAMAELRSIQARLSLWEEAGKVPEAVEASPQGAALHLLQLEERLPLERLARSFLLQRPAWRKRLLEKPSYGQVAEGLQELRAAIAVPPTRALMQGLLAKVPVRGGASTMPRPLAAEITEFLLEDSLAHVVLGAPVTRVQLGNGPGDLGMLATIAKTQAKALGVKVQS